MQTVTIPQALEIALQHHRSGRLAEAKAIYQQILAQDPNHADTLHYMGVIALQGGRNDLAVDLIRRAIAVNPLVADYHSNLGVALNGIGQPDEAIAECRRAIQLKPDFTEVHINLGNALKDSGHLDEAIAAYRKAIELKPDFAEAHSNLGNALRDDCQLSEAIAACRRAIEIRPNYVEAHNNLGNALKDRGHLDEAIAAYRMALKFKPDFAEIHSNLLLLLHNLPDCDAQVMFQEHRRWAEVHALPLVGLIKPCANDREPSRRLRIGYVSPDFREHSAAFFIESLLASHDQNQVEVFCYANVLCADSVTTRLQQHIGTWRTIRGMTDEQVAELIRDDRIDILVDLAGHTSHNRLLVFARKPAPIQVTWLGYPDTTGMGTMDYRLTDAHADPPGTTEHLHSEQLVRLPETFACFRPAEDSPLVGPLPALARGYITFASFHALAKLNDRLLESWAKILLQVPTSRLLMSATGLDEISRQRELSEFLASKGVHSERLEFKGRQPLQQYLALHNDVDLLLDSHPFTGHTIGCHALWMGVPVVTLAGDRHHSRMVTSVLTNLGLPELIAHTPDDYVRIASELAGDLPRLTELRGTLRERMRASPLTDAQRFARNAERAYREMWRTWCAKQSL